MYSETNAYFLNIKSGSFTKDGKEINFCKLTACDKDGEVQSYSIDAEYRSVIRKEVEKLPLFAPVVLSLEIKGKGQYMKAYCTNIAGKEE